MKYSNSQWSIIGGSLLLVLTLAAIPVSSSGEEDWSSEGNHANENVPIKCFQCNSWTNASCAELGRSANQSEYLQPCVGNYDGKQAFCRKTVQAIKHHSPRVIRSCGWMRHDVDCYHTDDDHHVENVCQCYTDACNLASRRRIAVAATFLATMTVLLVSV